MVGWKNANFRSLHKKDRPRVGRSLVFRENYTIAQVMMAIL